MNEVLITGIQMQDKIKIAGVSARDTAFVIETDKVKRSFLVQAICLQVVY